MAKRRAKNQRPRSFIEQAVARVSFAKCLLPTEVKLDRRHSQLHVVLDVINRETGEPARVDFTWNVPLLTSADQAVDWIYTCTRDAWVHELNEVFFVDGVRRHEPHDSNGQVVMAPDEVARKSRVGAISLFLEGRQKKAALLRAKLRKAEREIEAGQAALTEIEADRTAIREIT